MAMNGMLVDVVNSRIDDYCEKWQKDHQVVAFCWHFEHELCGFVELFHVISGLDKGWRDGVYAGEVPYSVELDGQVRSLFEKWIAVDKHIQACLHFFERQNYEGGVKGADDYRKNLDTAKATLAAWTRPFAAEMSPEVKNLLASLKDGRSQEDDARLNSLATEAIRKNKQRSTDSPEKWAESLAADMARIGE